MATIVPQVTPTVWAVPGEPRVASAQVIVVGVTLLTVQLVDPTSTVQPATRLVPLTVSTPPPVLIMAGSAPERVGWTANIMINII